jgi:hypothetical protein
MRFLLGLVFGFLMCKAFMCYASYLYVDRDNKCLEAHKSIVTCNPHSRVTWVEKFAYINFDAACWAANSHLKWIYCKQGE